ncbi:IS4/Tn5 family transposase DNA-binding protein [Caballeronia arationis]|uniref:IS4/Tn5 family transposase DNA-binding protein n=1 Tax=Caballeronia arationis TaxID=1777142 RepID=UPI000B352775
MAFTLTFSVEAFVREPTPWTQTEFEQLELGDARLDKRARLLMERMAADPMANWSDRPTQELSRGPFCEYPFSAAES